MPLHRDITMTQEFKKIAAAAVNSNDRPRQLCERPKSRPPRSPLQRSHALNRNLFLKRRNAAVRLVKARKRHNRSMFLSLNRLKFPSPTVHLNRNVLLSSLAGGVVHSARKRRNSQERGKRSGRLPLFCLLIPTIQTYLSVNFGVVAVPLLKTVLRQLQMIRTALLLKFFLTVCLSLRASRGLHNLVLSLTLLRRMMNIKSSSAMLQVTVNLPLRISLPQCKTTQNYTTTMPIKPSISSNSTSTTRIMKVSDSINFAAIFLVLFRAFKSTFRY